MNQFLSHSKKIIFFFIALNFFLASAFAQNNGANFLEQCPFTKGDSIQTVKQYYQILEEPKSVSFGAGAGATQFQYHFPQYGVWLFLDSNQQINSIRLEAPFKGGVGGVSIGSSLADLISIKGNVARPFQGFFDLDDQKRRKEAKNKLLEALPDPTPKYLINNMVAEYARIDAEPMKFMKAYSYGQLSVPGWARYDVSETTSRVHIILTNSCK